MKKIFTNGCFDVLHRGHLELFEYAKSLGYLYVGVDRDEKVRQDKGMDRPYNLLGDRIKMLQSLRSIDEIRSFKDTQGLEMNYDFLKEYPGILRLKYYNMITTV